MGKPVHMVYITLWTTLLYIRDKTPRLHFFGMGKGKAWAGYPQGLQAVLMRFRGMYAHTVGVTLGSVVAVLNLGFPLLTTYTLLLLQSGRAATWAAKPPQKIFETLLIFSILSLACSG